MLLWGLGCEVNTLADVALKALNTGLEQLLLTVVDGREDVDKVLGTVWSKLDWDGEEVKTGGGLDGLTTWRGEVDERWLDDVLLSLSGAENLLGKTESGVCHGESGRSSSVLGLDNLVTSELYALDEVGELVGWDVDGWLGLGEEWDDGLAGVATDDWDGGVLWVGGGAGQLGDKGLGADDIESGDTEEALWVEDTGLLEDLGGNWDGGVDWVGDDEDECLWCDLGDDLNEALDNTSVDVEEIVAGHAWLA